ncbi:MAG: hypothetical protein ACO3ID_10895 [Candidatus Nanopelagicales bacterium]
MNTAPVQRTRMDQRDVSPAATRRILIPVVVGAAAVAFTIPLLISPEAMPRPDPLTVATLLGLLAVSCVVGLVAAAWVWGEAAIARRRGRTDVAVFVIVYALGGAVVGMLLVALLPRVGFEGRAPAVVPIVSMAVMAAWTALLVGSMRDGRERISQTQRAMVEQAAVVVMTSESQAALIEDLRRQFNAELEGSLRPKFERTAERLEFEARFAEDHVAGSAAQVLTELTEASVRPFSQALDRRARDTRGRRGPLAFIRGVARHQPFRPTAVALIFVVSSVAEAWTGADPTPALVATAAGVALIFGILGTGNVLMRRWRQHHAVIFVATFGVLQLPTVWWIVRAQPSAGVAAVVEIAVTVLVSGCIVWLTSGFGHGRTAEAELLQMYADDLDSARIEVLAQGEILRAITRDAARALHGSLQSRLTACVVALDRAAQDQDVQAHAAAIAQARQILTEAWSVPAPQPAATDLDEVVRDKVALWQGLAGITAYVDPSLRGDHGRVVVRVGDIVEEGLCNAVRHGEADSVSVQVEAVTEGAGEFIRIRVVDDGHGPGQWSAGLGSAYIDEACAGRWSLEAAPAGGCVLDAWVSRDDDRSQAWS